MTPAQRLFKEHEEKLRELEELTQLVKLMLEGKNDKEGNYRNRVSER